MRLVLYTGKGGVGKTTTAAATAVHAAERGLRTLIVSVDAAHSLGDVLERPLAALPQEIAPRLHAVEVDARVEMTRHWGRIRDYLVALFRYQGIEEVIADELALLPGAEELCALLALDDYAAREEHDLIVVDCAPTATTLRLLTLPDVGRRMLRLLLVVQRALSTVVTPLARGIVPVPLPESGVFRDVDQLFYKKLKRLRRRMSLGETSVRLVVTPERMVIDEAHRAYTDLALFDVPSDAVVMNRLLPAAAADEAFFHDWVRVQEERLREVEERFAPLRLLTAPLQDDEVTGLERLAELGRLIFADVEPEAVLSTARRVRFARSGSTYTVHLPLPGARPDALEVSKLEDELLVRAGAHRRALKLPRRIAGLAIRSARLDGPELVVTFEREHGAAPTPALAEH